MKRSLVLLSCFGFSISAACADVNLSSGLRAHYNFNGNANDSSGNGFNGTLFGNPVFVQDYLGQPLSALSFDGIGDYVTIPDALFGPNISAFSFYSRVQVDALQEGDILQKGSQNGEAHWCSEVVHSYST